MRKLHLIIPFLCLFFIAGCESDDNSNTSKIIGKWDCYIQIDDRGNETKYSPDFFTIEFRTDGTGIEKYEGAGDNIFYYNIKNDTIYRRPYYEHYGTSIEEKDRIIQLDDKYLKLEKFYEGAFNSTPDQYHYIRAKEWE